MPGRYGALALRRSYGARAGAYKKRRRHYGAIAGQMRTAGYFGRYNQLGTEKKFHDTEIGSYNIPRLGQLHTTGLMGGIPNGTGESDRVGRKITLKSVHIKATIIKPVKSTLSNSSDVVRIIVGVDTQTNGVGPTIGQVLEPNNGGVGTQYPVNQYNNLSNKGRFIILKDKYININSQGGSGNGTTNNANPVYREFTYNRKLNIPVNYDGVTGGIAEIRDNCLFMIVMSYLDQETDIHIFNRVRYTDV